ncbi:MAG TPA: glycosyltransferase family A protein [Bacteroidota bacterium]|nr:glycosyltransferase family A protein [Bacteroidota bacterium]
MNFSVIVPTYNRLELLKKTLESLLSQNYEGFEIIVVNDGSTDGTHEFLSRLSRESRIRYVCQPNSGLAASRRAGLEIARGRYVAFTDDDCVTPPDWLQKFDRHFQGEQIAGVGGSALTGNPANLFAAANDMINEYFKSAVNYSGVLLPFLTGNNISYSREFLNGVGGPDSRFRMGAEDRDLLLRVVSAGGTVTYDPAIAVVHHNDSNFLSFVKHQYHQGKGSHLYYTLHRQTALRPRRFSSAVYRGLLARPFKSNPFPKALAFFCLIILAQCAVLSGYVAAALAGDPGNQ